MSTSRSPSGRTSRPSFAFTLWVVVFVAASLAYPDAFGAWFGFDLKYLIVPLIQVIMFGMGTTLSVRDFTRVFKLPAPVLLGMALQFGVMPLGGWAIARSLGFEPEIATGIILVGSVSGGVASNLMAYLAGGDVALSVTMTACSTVLSPLVTPRLMDLLAGAYMPIPVTAMTVDILNMIVVPIAAGLVAHKLLYDPDSRLARPRSLACLVLLGSGVALVAVLVPIPLGAFSGLRAGVAIGCGLVAAVALASWIGRAVAGRTSDWVDFVLPKVSMWGICFIIAIITARSRSDLLRVGPLLVAAAAVHNAFGYALGYWSARGLGLPERVCRTISFEVGMQNAGMASALAMGTLESAKAALAPAIFGPWMNVSGSLLANLWRRKPVAGPTPDSLPDSRHDPSTRKGGSDGST